VFVDCTRINIKNAYDESQLMKNTILSVIILIALYAFLRNVSVLSGQLIWLPRENIFYSFFLPLLMLMSALTAFINKRSINIFILSLLAMVFDAINRLALFVDNIYFYYRFKGVPLPPPPPLKPDTVIITINYWPSYLILLIEIILIFIIIIWSRRKRVL
jgi:hypothetical protein